MWEGVVPPAGEPGDECAPCSQELKIGAQDHEAASKDAYPMQPLPEDCLAREAHGTELPADEARKARTFVQVLLPTKQRECLLQQDRQEAPSFCSTEAEETALGGSSMKSGSPCSSTTFMSPKRVSNRTVASDESFNTQAQQSTAAGSAHPVTRSGRVARKLSRKLVERVSGRRPTRPRTTLTTLFTGGKRVPAPMALPDSAPLFSAMLHNLTIPELHAALARTENCPLIRFLSKAFLGSDFRTTDWGDCTDITDTSIMQTHYTMPVPRDIPEVVGRLLRVPESIRSTTVWRLRADSQELLLVQQSSTKDVLYGDRCRLQDTVFFKEDPSGGVKVNTWTDVLWDMPLPWTHAFIKHIIEKKAKADSAASMGQLVQILQETALH